MTLCFSITALIQIAEAKDYGVFGEVFDIAELDLIDQIKERLQNLERNGTLKDIQQEIQREVVKNVKTPKPLMNIRNTEHPRTFEFDPTIELTVDLKDHKGKVFAKKGTKYNPLEMISFRKPLLFIDGDDANQVKWAMLKMDKFKLDFSRNSSLSGNLRVEAVLESSCTHTYTPVLRSSSPVNSSKIVGFERSLLSKIILVKGSPLELQEKLGIPVYFDQYGTLTKRIGIKQVPAIVWQEVGRKVLTVSEETAKHLENDEGVK